MNAPTPFWEEKRQCVSERAGGIGRPTLAVDVARSACTGMAVCYRDPWDMSLED